jgi:hypothetical protein
MLQNFVSRMLFYEDDAENNSNEHRSGKQENYEYKLHIIFTSC